MTDEEIYKEIKKYFCIQEFVNKKTYDKYGEGAWQFMCPRLLHTILIIRTTLDKKITINSWKWGGKLSQRGLRTNLGQIVLKMVKRGKLYLSAHIMGRAVDFDVEGMSAEDVRMWIVKNEKLFPYKIRLEHIMNGKPVNWVHIDVFWNKKNKHIYLFNI